MQRQKDFMKPIRLFDCELWFVNMNHITGPTSHIRGIYGKTPASHAQMYDTRLKQEHLMCFRYRYWQRSPPSNHRVPLWSPDRTGCVTLHFEGVFAYNTRFTGSGGLAAETGRDEVTARGISPNPSRLGYLIYSTLAKVIPYCYLWPTLMFNVSLW